MYILGGWDGSLVGLACGLFFVAVIFLVIHWGAKRVRCPRCSGKSFCVDSSDKTVISNQGEKCKVRLFRCNCCNVQFSMIYPVTSR